MSIKESFKTRERGKLPSGAGIRLLSTAEVSALQDIFSKRTGLKHNQFVANSYGFPIIPIPEVRKAYGKIRLAPPNVENGFLGHPIYWINPEITKMRVGVETPEQWAIRMFYVIDAFGYWDSKAQFIDHLAVHEYSRDEQDVRTYHIKSNPDCKADKIPLLSFDDLDVPLEEAGENYEIAMKRCSQLVKNEYDEFRKKQEAAYTVATKVLGPKVWDPFCTFEETGELWDMKFRKHLDRLAVEYNFRAQNGEVQRSDLVQEFHRYLEELIKTLTTINKASSLLTLPVQAASPGVGVQERLATVCTLLMISTRKENIRQEIYSSIEPVIQDCLVNRDMQPNGVDPILRKMADAYSEAWRRLRLAYINYNSVRAGMPPFVSYTEMVNSLVSATQDLEDIRSKTQHRILEGE